MTNNERNKQTVRHFFEAIEAEDAGSIANLFAPDGVHINPYHCGMFPEGANGREAIKDYWEPTFPNFDGMEFPIHDLFAMEDDRVFVRYTGRIKLKDDAGWYENEYFSTFAFDKGGSITEYVEVFNPVVAAKGFGLFDKLSG